MPLDDVTDRASLYKPSTHFMEGDPEAREGRPGPSHMLMIIPTCAKF